MVNCLLRALCVLWVLCCSNLAGHAATATGTALLRHAPVINGNATVEGSLHQMTGETVTLNGGATVTNDLLVPGTPPVVQNGRPTFGGIVPGTGSVSPSNYQIILNGNARLGTLRTRTAPLTLPVVAAPAQPAGTRTVVINSAGQSAGSFATLRNLTLNGNTGQYAVPPGVYGEFTANGCSGWTLGVAGAVQPAL